MLIQNSIDLKNLTFYFVGHNSPLFGTPEEDADESHPGKNFVSRYLTD